MMCSTVLDFKEKRNEFLRTEFLFSFDVAQNILYVRLRNFEINNKNYK